MYRSVHHMSNKTVAGLCLGSWSSDI